MANRFIEAMNKRKETYTENGALSNASSGSFLVDFFFHGGTWRNETNETLMWSSFVDAYKEDPNAAMRILFYLRDIRGGQGERRVFRSIVANVIAKDYFNLATWFTKNMYLIPEYGRWDDLVDILWNVYQEQCRKNERNQIIPEKYVPDSVDMFIGTALNFLSYTLKADMELAAEGKPCSLLAKWMPSENASSPITRKKAIWLIDHMYGEDRKGYRKTLSRLRSYLKVVETKMSSGEWSDIDYPKVPSKAMLKYRKAFDRRDNIRYAKYLAKVAEGKEQINASTIYPYEIFEKLGASPYGVQVPCLEEKTLEELWKNLPDYVDDIQGLVVADTSGSMHGRPMAVSVSLALYIAERNKNKNFKDCFISFSEYPKFHVIKGNTLKDRMRSVILGDIANTDIQKVFDLILKKAKDNDVPVEDMPKIIYIVSDGQFDAMTENNSMTNFRMIQKKYAEAMYPMPKLVFWNVSSYGNDVPVTIHDTGTILISGCSPAILKYAMKVADSPLAMVYEVANSARYAPIRATYSPDFKP